MATKVNTNKSQVSVSPANGEWFTIDELKSILSTDHLYMAQLPGDEVMIMTGDYSNISEATNNLASMEYNEANISPEQRQEFAMLVKSINMPLIETTEDFDGNIHGAVIICKQEQLPQYETE